jgi:hypothetical protein
MYGARPLSYRSTQNMTFSAALHVLQDPEHKIEYSDPKEADGDSDDLDYVAIRQSYCNIIAGACLAIGLRYAVSPHSCSSFVHTYFVITARLFFVIIC